MYSWGTYLSCPNCLSLPFVGENEIKTNVTALDDFHIWMYLLWGNSILLYLGLFIYFWIYIIFHLGEMFIHF